jgi:hypothetical protein
MLWGTSLTRGRVCNLLVHFAVTFQSVHCRTHDHNLLSHLRLLGSLFVAFYDLQVYGCSSSLPPHWTPVINLTESFLILGFTGIHIFANKISLLSPDNTSCQHRPLTALTAWVRPAWAVSPAHGSLRLDYCRLLADCGAEYLGSNISRMKLCSSYIRNWYYVQSYNTDKYQLLNYPDLWRRSYKICIFAQLLTYSMAYMLSN